MTVHEILKHATLTCRDSDIGTTIASPSHAAAIFLPLMLRDRETLVVMCLDDDRRVITAFVAAIGTVDMVQCEPSSVFRPAMLHGAAHILIAHNHPSGDPTPSIPDIQTTKALEMCAKILGIGFVDHLVLTTSGKYRSIAEYMERGF
jgi:DNA repair protein RadC